MDDCKIIAMANQKSGVGKTTTTANLGIGLANEGKRVLLVDSDPQGSLTISLGISNPDDLPCTLATAMMAEIQDAEITNEAGIIHHAEGVDVLLVNIELSSA